MVGCVGTNFWVGISFLMIPRAAFLFSSFFSVFFEVQRSQTSPSESIITILRSLFIHLLPLYHGRMFFVFYSMEGFFSYCGSQTFLQVGQTRFLLFTVEVFCFNPFLLLTAVGDLFRSDNKRHGSLGTIKIVTCCAFVGSQRFALMVALCSTHSLTPQMLCY